MHKPKAVIILGNGIEAWLSAAILSHLTYRADLTHRAHLTHHAHRETMNDVTICVAEHVTTTIDPPSISSSSMLASALANLGMKESDWMPLSNATYNVGKAFEGWSNSRKHNQYFHGFSSELDQFYMPLFASVSTLRRRGADVDAHPDKFFFSAYLAKENRIPIAPENFPFECDYGYSIDTLALVNILKRIALNNGVTESDEKIEHAVLSQSELGVSVASLTTQNGNTLTADLYLDCTGEQSLLSQQADNDTPPPSRKALLPPHIQLYLSQASAPQAAVNHDVIRALPCGWMQTLSLRNRIDSYVYLDTRYLSSKKEKSVLLNAFDKEERAKIAPQLDQNNNQVCFFKHKKCWENNVIRVGSAYYNDAPLELNGTHWAQVISSAIKIALTKNNTPDTVGNFNDSINQLTNCAHEYTHGHFYLNTRSDTPYWLQYQHKTSVSPTFTDIANTWLEGKDPTESRHAKNPQHVFNTQSWNRLFTGNHFFPETNKVLEDPEDYREKIKKMTLFYKNCAKNFRRPS